MKGAEPDSWEDARGAEIYAEVARSGRLYPALAARLVTALEPLEAGRYLDLATGSGLVAGRLYARLGDRGSVVGADRARAMLRVARRAVPLPALGFVLADPAALPFADGVFRGAACSAAAWHFPALGRALAELHRVVAPGGRVVLNVPASQLAGEPDLPPAAIQLALARGGSERFGLPPEPGGPVRSRAEILRLAANARLSIEREGCVELDVTQRELVELLAVPAVGARMYPTATAAGRAAWIEAASRSVDLEEVVRVRWWELVLSRPRTGPSGR